jgi:AraC-like DNA-binding protein
MPSDPEFMRDRLAVAEVGAPSGHAPGLPADPLSDVLALLSPRSALSARLVASGDWALRFAAFEGMKFVALTRGHCWLEMSHAPPVRLQAGDCFLMARGLSYRLASDLALGSVDAHGVFAQARDGIARVGEEDGQDVRRGGAVTELVGGRFDFETLHARLLLDALPSLVHVKAVSKAVSKAAKVVHWLLAQLVVELAGARPGAALMRDHLAQLLLLQMLRCHLASPRDNLTGWLAALTDARLTAALACMHSAPSTRWTLEQLANSAAMSRSTFALRFKSVVGQAPLDYLLRLRMMIAARALRSERATVSAIAGTLGYDSDSAFSHAFKRVMGMSPKAYRTGTFGALPQSGFWKVSPPPQSESSHATCASSMSDRWPVQA